MTPSANFNTLSNIFFQGTFYALEIHTKSAHLKYLTPVIQSEIFPLPTSTDE